VKLMKRTALSFLALLAMAGPVAAADGAASRVQIDYRAPELSVEASGVTLAQVLTAIGAKVGFTVVDSGTLADLVTVSIHGTSVDDALRQLLRGTNYSTLYREAASPGGTPIDKIVLLGAPGIAPPPSGVPERSQATAAVPVGPAAPVAANNPSIARSQSVDSGSPPVATPFSPQWNPLLSWAPDPNADITSDPSMASNSVGDLLKQHAQNAALQTAAPGTTQPPPAPPAGSVDATLAETTRRAQQDLAALVKGLAAATQALQDSLAANPAANPK
jgi:hypothetical protein